MTRITSPLYYEQISERLLVGCICEPAVLELCADVQTDDFSAMKHRAAFGALRELQARGEPIGPVEVHEEMRRLDWEMGKHTSEWVTLESIIDMMNATLPYMTHAPQRFEHQWFRNGIEIDWSRFLDANARVARIVRNTVDEERRAACERLGIASHTTTTTTDDWSDETRVEMRRHFVLRDAETLRFYRQNPEICVYPTPAEVPDEDQRVRVERQSYRRRVRREVG